jgi:hypothetical protein
MYISIAPAPRAARRICLSAAVVLAVISIVPLAARATPRPLPFTYPVATLPAGKLEIEQYVDLVPVRIARELPTGEREAVWSMRSALQTELEFGITDRVEGALYFALRQSAAEAPTLRFDGLKQRVRARFADPGAWPVDLGAYLEVAEFHNEFELEQKLIVSRRFGALLLDANLWVEQEYYFQDEEWKFIYNPTVGAALELTPALSVGLEYWLRGRFDEPEPPTASAASSEAPTGTRHYLGPTLLVQRGEYFLSMGGYLRVDHLGDSLPVGEQFGRVWLRLLVGVGL